jgi:urease accessory protein
VRIVCLRSGLALLMGLILTLGGVAAAVGAPLGLGNGMSGPLLQPMHAFGLLGLGMFLDMQGRGDPGPGLLAAFCSGLLLACVVRLGLVIPQLPALAVLLLLIAGLALLWGKPLVPAWLGLIGAAAIGGVHGGLLGQWDGLTVRLFWFWPGMLAACLLLTLAGIGLSASLYRWRNGLASRLCGAALLAWGGFIVLGKIV